MPLRLCNEPSTEPCKSGWQPASPDILSVFDPLVSNQLSLLHPQRCRLKHSLNASWITAATFLSAFILLTLNDSKTQPQATDVLTLPLSVVLQLGIYLSI